MNPEMNMTYETFIRRAFGLKNGNIIERWGDPASLANTDVFSVGKLSSVKAAVAYSMEIFNYEIKERFHEELSEQQYNQLDAYVDSVINAQTKVEIYESITSYVDEFENSFLR